MGNQLNAFHQMSTLGVIVTYVTERYWIRMEKDMYKIHSLLDITFCLHRVTEYNPKWEVWDSHISQTFMEYFYCALGQKESKID